MSIDEADKIIIAGASVGLYSFFGALGVVGRAAARGCTWGGMGAAGEIDRDYLFVFFQQPERSVFSYMASVLSPHGRGRAVPVFGCRAGWAPGEPGRQSEGCALLCVRRFFLVERVADARLC